MATCCTSLLKFPENVLSSYPEKGLPFVVSGSPAVLAELERFHHSETLMQQETGDL
jgi:hypothetical protein